MGRSLESAMCDDGLHFLFMVKFHIIIIFEKAFFPSNIIEPTKQNESTL